MANTWLNADGLELEFGVTKAVINTAGEYVTPGANRVVEVYIDLTTLTSTAAIQSQTTRIPGGANWVIEKVEVFMEEASASGTSFSVGLINSDRSTIVSGYSTAFVNGLINASTNTLGNFVSLTIGQTYVGGLVGTHPTSASQSYYITALSSGTYTTGKARVRISMHGIGTIPN